MDIVRFENQNLLYLLLLIIPMIAYYIYKIKGGKASVSISSVAGVKGLPRTARYYFRHLPFVLRCMAIALIIVAIARPQSAEDNQTVSTEGIDIVMAIDVSTSMLARDFKPDRLTAAKEVASKFILERRNDRLGLVVFAGESFTQSPLTTDHATVINLLNQVGSGVIEDGTAIGSGLATAVNRLKDSPAKSKVIILLTDGVNNRGQITPQTAAELAAALDVKVYTIGVGTEGTAPYPAIDAWGNKTFIEAKVEIDEAILTEVSELTGGKYFRAIDNESLTKVYEEINTLEKSKIDVENYILYKECFARFMLAALLLLMLEMLVRHLYLRQIP